jgi:hypothetical protein
MWRENGNGNGTVSCHFPFHAIRQYNTIQYNTTQHNTMQVEFIEQLSCVDATAYQDILGHGGAARAMILGRRRHRCSKWCHYNLSPQ